MAALIAGLYAAFFPIWTLDPENNKAMISMIGVGAVTAVLATASLYRPGVVALDSLVALMGVLFLVAPWVMDFSTGFAALAWTARIAGGVTLIAGAADVTLDRSEHRGIVTNR